MICLQVHIAPVFCHWRFLNKPSSQRARTNKICSWCEAKAFQRGLRFSSLIIRLSKNPSEVIRKANSQKISLKLMSFVKNQLRRDKESLKFLCYRAFIIGPSWIFHFLWAQFRAEGSCGRMLRLYLSYSGFCTREGSRNVDDSESLSALKWLNISIIQ